LALAAGFTLSFVVEISQMYIAGRHSSATDLMTNTLGAALGAGLALWLSPRSAESSDSVGGLGDGDLHR
jgi:glycopeptide antibiotics resistance protein